MKNITILIMEGNEDATGNTLNREWIVVYPENAKKVLILQKLSLNQWSTQELTVSDFDSIYSEWPQIAKFDVQL